MTPLTCTVCDRAVSDCRCPDIDDRLRRIAHGREMTDVMFKWCRRCDKHSARCLCATPQFFIISADQDVTATARRGLPNAAGGFTVPELRRP
jgi:hypothetical protein